MNTEILSTLKYDCRFFDASKPCAPHKQHGVFCGDCSYYQPVKERILVVKFGSIGDVVRSTAMLPGLRRVYPQAHITWLTAPNAAAIFKNNPLVDKVYSDPSDYLPVLETVNFNLLINPETDIRSSGIASMAKAHKKKGYCLNAHGVVLPNDGDAVDWYVLGVNDELKKQNTETYFSRIYRLMGIPYHNEKPEIYLSEAEKKLRDNFKKANGLDSRPKVIGINTGSGFRWPLKKWTMEYYTELINRLHKLYPSYGLVLFGGPEEREFNAQLMKLIPESVVNGGTDNSLRDFFALVDAVDVLMTPDSLALHAGTGLGKPVIVYTGPTSYTELDVFGKGAVIHSDIDCLVCYLNACDKKTNCMNTLSVEQMFAAMKPYLD